MLVIVIFDNKKLVVVCIEIVFWMIIIIKLLFIKLMIIINVYRINKMILNGDSELYRFVVLMKNFFIFLFFVWKEILNRV